MSNSANIVFTRAFSGAIDPMIADKGACGQMPLSAFQYCEGMRAASGLGWYIFPPTDISIMFDGKECLIADDGHWRTFTSESLGPTFEKRWKKSACPELQDWPPSHLRALPEPGIIQIWSGFFVKTAPNWHLLVRPLVNMHSTSAYICFEAIVETDTFHPLPLFVNLKIMATNREIVIQKEHPLFQVVAMSKEVSGGQTATFHELPRFDVMGDDPIRSAVGPEGDVVDDVAVFWNGLTNTMRIPGSTSGRTPGAYGASVRRRLASRKPKS